MAVILRTFAGKLLCLLGSCEVVWANDSRHAGNISDCWRNFSFKLLDFLLEKPDSNSCNSDDKWWKNWIIFFWAL